MAAAVERLVMAAAAGAQRLELECLQAKFVELLLQTHIETPAALRRRDWVPHAGIRAAREHLRSHFDEEPRLADLARVAGLSRFAFGQAPGNGALTRTYAAS